MNLCLVRSPRKAEWTRALTRLPNPHLLQTWEWGSFKSRHGWDPTHRLWIDCETQTPRAAALVLTRQLGPLPIQVMYVPKGPILDYADSGLLRTVLDHLEIMARQSRAPYVKIDPDVGLYTVAGRSVLETLRDRGWRCSDEEIQFRNTILIDLTPPLDELLMGMKSKWRYNVRLAMRRGVKVRAGTLNDLPLLYDMYQDTAERGSFIIRPWPYYRDAWSSFMEAGLAQPLIAEVEGEAAAMVIIYCFAGRAYFMYGASYSEHLDKMPNNLLQWEAMKWAKNQGCTVYDMWGAPDELDESDPMWGVYRFKIGFGGEFVERVGAWDYPASPLLYQAYTLVAPVALAVMRWLHRHQVGHGS